MFLLRELTWRGTIDYVGFTHKINGLAGRERFEAFWHTDCATNQKYRGPSPKWQTSREAGTQSHGSGEHPESRVTEKRCCGS